MFKSFGRAIVFVIDGIAKCCAILLVSLGLWISVLYSIVFFIILKASGATFVGGMQTLFFVGLGISLMAGFVFALSLYRRKRAKLQVVPVKNNLKNSEKPVKDAQQTKTETLTQTESYYNDTCEKTLDNTVAKVNDDLSAKAVISKTILQQKSEESCSGEDTGEKLGADILWKRLNEATVPQEKPMIFATRSDSTLFIYEYSDRLQFWRKTGKKMTFVGTEFKNKNTLSDK